MSNSKKPIAKIQMYPVNAAIWRNENDKGEAFYNVTFERTYKDDKGEYQSSSSFSAGDLLLLAKVADRAHSKIYSLREQERQTQPNETE